MIDTKTYILIVILAISGAQLFASTPEARRDSDIRVIQSDGSGITIEFVPIFSERSKLYRGGEEYDVVTFENQVDWDSVTPGGPHLGARALTLALPGLLNQVRVLSAESENIAAIMLPPVPSFIEVDQSFEELYERNRESYAARETFPALIASLSDVGETRGVILGRLTIVPLQYNPSLRQLKQYSRIVVRVDFGQAEAIAIPPDHQARTLALNPEIFSVQKHVRTASLRNSVLSNGAWYRFAVTEDGMYKISGRMLLEAGVPQSTNPATIRIFGNGGFELPVSVNAPYADDLLENAVFARDEVSPGKLDGEDAIVFFGKGVRGWKYNRADRSISHYLNHYTETNYYWLTYGSVAAKPMATVASLNDPGAHSPSTVDARVFREDEKFNILGSGLEWLGQSFNSRTSMTYVHSLSGLDASRPIRYRVQVGARSPVATTFIIEEHGARIATPVLQSTILGRYEYPQVMTATVDRSIVPAFTETQSRLKFTFDTSGSSGTGYINWYEITYQRALQAQNDALNFFLPDTDAVLRYAIGGFSGPEVRGFNVATFDSVVMIGGGQTSGDTYTFGFAARSGSPAEIYVVGESGYKSPGALTRVSNQDLHGDTTNAAYIIIAPTEFLPAAQRLKAHRELPGNGSLRTLTVSVEQIYNEFGGGLPMPVAIRNYLRYRYENQSVPPRYVLLFGDGDYDYKRITTTGPNWMPPWETAESYFPIGTYSTDDDFAIFNSGNRVAMALGRLTARSVREAHIMVDKILEYENDTEAGPWKLRTTFVADDGLAGLRDDGRPENDLFLHLDDAEGIAKLTPALFERNKIYLHEYPVTYTPGGRRKPLVNAAIVDQINRGTLVLNFNGHGNPRLWTHEAVFVRESDFSLLRNKGKYFFLVAATCNYSYFDAVGDQSGGEMLVGMPDAGAIAVLSATRAVYASSNYDLNSTMYRNLFQIGTDGRIAPQRIGDALYRTKQIHNGPGSIADNDRKFFLLGDPALSIGFPEMFASVDSINETSGADVAQLRALGDASLVARVRDSSSRHVTSFSGKAELIVYDAKKKVLVEDFIYLSNRPPLRRVDSFYVQGAPLFRGEQSVSGGVMTTRFIVPKDISYEDDFGRVSMYFWNESQDGAGFSTNLRIGGTDTTAEGDSEGPRISLFLDSKSFRPGDVVTASPTLIAELRDRHGINTSGAGVGHRLEAWIDDQPESIDLTEFYKSNADTYMEGTVEYPLTGLTPGSHTIKLRAWDTYNNASTSETNFDVLTGEGLKVTNVMNYPNPFSSATLFTFDHNRIGSVDVEVKIYTVAGRLIQSLSAPGMSGSPVALRWDGRDKDGDGLSNGIYLYKVIVKAEQDRFVGEAYGKLSILK